MVVVVVVVEVVVQLEGTLHDLQQYMLNGMLSMYAFELH